MPRSADCPDPKALERLALGQLPGGEAGAVEDHLLGCPECVTAARSLTVDCPLVAVLRHRAVFVVPQGDDVDAVVARVRAAAEAHANLETLTQEPRADTPGDPDDADPTSSLAPAQEPGELGRLGPYRVLRVLGRGGMGVVYEAHDPQLHRSVAVKVMKRSRAASPERRERFLREARLAASLTHDNVVPVYHVGEDGGVFYLVMPMLAGESLAARLARGGPLPPAEVARVGREAAEGLAAAHANGLIHRDMKPANLWLEGDAGRVRILDFGLAQSAAAGAGLTKEGQLVGTPAYMPPEQTRGSTDPRSDVYGLGVTLYEAATGRLPFLQSDLMALLTAVNLDVPPDPADLDPGVPRPLSDLIARCLAKDPAARPQSARELADALREPPAEPKPTEPAPAVRPRRRWPVRVAVAAGLLAAGLWLAGPTVYRIATDSGELVVTSRDPDIEVTVRQNGEVVEVLDLKTRQRVTLKAGKYTIELTRGADGLALETSDFTLTRNGVETARVTLRPRPMIPPADGTPVAPAPREAVGYELLGHADAVPAVALDPAGRFAVSAGYDGTVRVWDLAARVEAAKATAHGRPLFAVAVSPDGKWVAAAGAGPGVFRWQVGENLALTPARPVGETTPRFEAVSLTAGGRLFALAADGGVAAWQTANGRVLFPPIPDTRNPGGVTTAAVSPDGGRVLVGCKEGGFVHLWNVAPAEHLTWFEGHTDVIRGVAFIGGGRTAVTASLDATARVWEVETGKELRRLAHPAAVRAVAPLADGKRVLTGCDDGKVRVWDADAERELKALAGHRGRVLAVAATADGRRAVSAGEDGAVRVWNLPAE